MRSIRISVLLCCCLAAAIALAQGSRKPGLWEMTTSTTWQQPPMPPGMTAPAGSAFSGAPHTTQICLTQAMIDKYGAPMPQSHGDCQVSNVSIASGSMSADWVCSGQMSGKGTIESHWTEDGHATGKVHFTGTMQMGSRSAPIEWTSGSTSMYKGPDCGSVKPMPMPNGK
ncbi:DUF3617 domain-containing protein [Terracidiphilus gabretensis]|uniref:DUF3617 domain-containing protein n=1 Tax=Terracidiphilus gabretensis TaxID=1577687 RepID=UPI00071B45C5|nr:DUF3617 domain-containing protein [Terracidiphilus gabretensis]